MINTVVCVLRSGGEYRAEHVDRLREQVKAYHPDINFVCLGDEQLMFGWPGWWSKMELFRPDLPADDILYLDLDTTVVGPLTPLLSLEGPWMMRDVYRPRGLQSSVMVIPHWERAMVWREWNKDPVAHMDKHAVGGDQAFLETVWLSKARRFQDFLPGILVSYKADKVAANGIPSGASLVIHHGKPRPWEV